MQFPGLAIEHGIVYSTDDIIEFHGLRDLSGILFVQLRFHVIIQVVTNCFGHFPKVSQAMTV